MIKLTSTTIAIVVLIDSNERINNLKLIINYFKSNFEVKISILEVGEDAKVFPLIRRMGIGYNFYTDGSKYLNISKYRNLLTLNCHTDIIGLWDTDMLVPTNQVYDAVNKIISKKADIAYPYDGKFIELNSSLSTIYEKSKSLDLIEKILHNRALPAYGNISVGGAVFIDKNKYIKAGMENEKFKGWGHDDIERYKRFEIMGYEIYRSKGYAYHLYHPRFIDKNKQIIEEEANQSRQVFINICSLKRNELIDFLTIK